jgi:Co/Zn/Cd efflux system component
MSGCCNDSCAVEQLQQRQRGTLRAVLWINLLMFFVIATAALFAHSSALLSDSLDNLGDALTYILSLYAVSRGAVVKAKVALFKGVVILIGACAVAGHVIYKLIFPVMPVVELMSLFSLLGLLANGVCLYLLWRHRHEDVNMSSVWECSRNDIMSNIAVLLTSAAVWLTASGWPDIIIASLLVILLMRSAMRVIRSATQELKAQQ